MNQNELQSAIALHQKAFAFLLDARTTGHAASRPFDEKTLAAWQNAHSCLEWINRHYEELPAAFRPERSEAGAFAQFLVSFFATSFAVSKVQRDGVSRLQIRALPTRRLDGSKKSQHAKGKERRAADSLRTMALHALGEMSAATDANPGPALSDLSAPLLADLTLWTYAWQLVNRSQFASQGPAVYRLWLDLPEKVRRNFNAEVVWQSRSRLQQFLSHSFQPVPVS